MSELRRRMMMQQAGEKIPVPNNNQIIYKTSNGNILSAMSSICNATLISNEIVGDYIFATYNNDVTQINNWGNNNLRYIDLPETCTTFSRIAFDYTYYLERVILRATHYTFGAYSFYQFMYGLAAKATLYATVPPTKNGTCFGYESRVRPTIEVPKGCAGAYRNSSSWSAYTIIEMK